MTAASYSFRPAKREDVQLLIGLAGGTGSGKTFTALELASGIAGDKPFAVIDTENRRALHYAEMFRFDHLELRAPFRPEAYEGAIVAADNAGYPVIVVDSASHEHAGDGGLLDWHDEEVDRMAGPGADWKRREACNMAGWIKPKMAHKAMMTKLLAVRAHVILCFRAEEKVEMIKEGGKTVIVPKKSLIGIDGWIPVCEKSVPFECTVSFLLTATAPGVPKPIKLQEQHRALFPLDKPLTRESGRLIAQWAAGGEKKRPDPDSPGTAQVEQRTPTEDPPPGEDAPKIDAEQAATLANECVAQGIKIDSLCSAAGVQSLDQIAAADLPRAKAWIDKKKASK